MKKVLILTFTFPPNSDGVAEAASSMAYGLADRGFEVVVATSHLEARTNFHPHPHVEIKQFRIDGNENLRIGISGEIENYLRFLVEMDADYLIVHCCDSWPATLAQKLFPKLKGKTVMVSHGFATHILKWRSQPPWGLAYWLGWQWLTLRLPWILHRYDHLVFLSIRQNLGRFFDHWMARLSGCRNISVIPNGVDQGKFESGKAGFREKYGIGRGPFFLCVANFSERKNQQMALRAFLDLKDEKASIVFVGSSFNNYSEDLFRIRDSFDGKKQRVFILENIERESVISAFQECDVFVLPSHDETQPIVLLEAMACGKPFISTDTGCVIEMPGGAIVTSREEMTGMMEKLLADPQLRVEYGKRGRDEYLRKYRREMILDAYEAVLRNKLQAS